LGLNELKNRFIGLKTNSLDFPTTKVVGRIWLEDDASSILASDVLYVYFFFPENKKGCIGHPPL
jgi:hypothetical protein